MHVWSHRNQWRQTKHIAELCRTGTIQSTCSWNRPHSCSPWSKHKQADKQCYICTTIIANVHSYQGQWWSIFNIHLERDRLECMTCSITPGRQYIPVADGAMVAAVWLDQLTSVTVSNTTTFVPLDNTKMDRQLTQNILIINLLCRI